MGYFYRGTYTRKECGESWGAPAMRHPIDPRRTGGCGARTRHIAYGWERGKG